MARNGTGKKAAFLGAYRQLGNLTLACEAAEVPRRTVYNWRQDPEFEALFLEAEQEAADRLEHEARRRAVEGVERPVYHRGRRVDTVREYSDTLLIFLLNGARPEKYKQRVSQEVSGPGGEPVPVKVQVDLL